jgi:hypothetical protein
MIKAQTRIAFGILFVCGSTLAQVTPNAKPAEQSKVPLPTQIKQTVVFLRTVCLHDFAAESDSLTKEKLMQMPLKQEALVARQLIDLTSKLHTVKQIAAKLSPEDEAYLKQNVPLSDDAAGIAAEASWRFSILVKLTTLTADDLAGLKPEEVALLPSNEELGTGFCQSVGSSSFGA